MPAKPTYEDLEKRVCELESAEAKSKRMLDEMQQEKNRYQNLFEHMLHEVHVWEFVFDDHGNIRTWKLVDANPAALTSWNKTLPEVIGKTPDEMFPDSNATEQFLPIVEKIHREGTAHRWESYFPDTGQILHMISVPFGDYFISTGFDVTEPKQAEETLRRKHEMLKRTEAIAHVGSWEWEIATDTVTWSEELYRIFQLDPGDEAPNWADHPKLYHPKDFEKLLQAAETAIADGKPYEIELRAFRKDGETRICTAKGFPETGADGQVVRLFGFLQDITDRKLLEESLAVERKRLSMLLEAFPGFIYLQAPDYSVPFANQYFMDHFGDPQNRPCYNVLWHREIPCEPCHTFKVFETKTPQVWEWSEAPDGKIYMIHDSPFLDVDGTELVLEIGLDVTDRRKAEDELRKSERELQRTLDATVDGIWTWHFKTEKMSFSSRYYQMLGYQPAAFPASYENWIKLIHPDDREKALAIAEEYLQTKPDLYENEFRLKTSGGGYRWINAKGRVVEKDENGDAVYMIGNHQDITDRKQTEQLLKESEERFRLAMEFANDGLFDWDLETNEIYYSPVWKRLLGYEDNEIPNDFSVWETLTHPQDVERSWKMQQELINKQRDRFEIEFKMKHKDGYWVDILARANAIFDDMGKAVRIIGTHVDITDRKQTELALKESEERFKALHNASFGGIAIHDKGIILECNKGMSDLTGYGYNELIGMNGLSLISDDTRDHVIANINSGYEKPYESTGVRKNGEKYPLRLEARNIPYKGKEVRVVEFRDITDQKKSEAALRESEEKYRLIAENMSDVISVMDMNLRFTYVSPSIKRLTGYTVEEAMKHSVEDIMTPESFKKVLKAFEEEMMMEASGNADPYRTRIIEFKQNKKDLSIVWVEASCSFLRDIDQNPAGILVISRDISDRKQAEAERERLMAAIEQSGDAILVTDANGNIQYVNPAFVKVSGYPWQEVINRNSRILKSGHQDKAFYQQLWETISAGQTWSGRMVNRKKDGSFYTEDATISPVFDASGKIINFVAVKRDVTEHLELSARLQQAQKLESIGTLAGGIAHDFNNILSSLIGFTELALDDVEKGSSIEDSLQEIYSGGKRARDLVKQILAFARQSDDAIKPIQIDTVATEVLKLFRASIPTTIQIDQDIKKNLTIMGNSTQVHQVLMNICTNSAQAMEESGGILKVSIKDITIDKSDGLKDLIPGEYAEIKVSDTGVGIDPAILDKIFDPFFTTKETGQGTGMGLAMVHGIIKSYNGLIAVDSEPGQGTVFTVYLPLIKDRKEPDSYQPEILPTGDERILLVDDEIPIVKMTSQILQKLGYEVVFHTSSINALALFRSEPDAFDLVITDMTMPEMTGDKLAVELMKIRQGIPVILCTGYSSKISDKTAVDIGIKAFAYKPVSKADLAKIVRKVLDETKK